MRHPLNKAAWSFILAALGAGLLLLAVVLYDRVGQAFSTIVGIVGMTMAAIFLFTFAWALLSAVGYARLASGKGVLARWHVSAQDWDRFRAFDKTRAAEAPADPECIEFPKSYPRSKGGSLDLTLRVPVPRSAREEGVRGFEFFRPQKG